MQMTACPMRSWFHMSGLSMSFCLHESELRISPLQGRPRDGSTSSWASQSSLTCTWIALMASRLGVRRAPRHWGSSLTTVSGCLHDCCREKLWSWTGADDVTEGAAGRRCRAASGLPRPADGDCAHRCPCASSDLVFHRLELLSSSRRCSAELLAHWPAAGCDALAVHLIIGAVACSLAIGVSWKAVVGTLGIMIPWQLAHWEEYHSGRDLSLAKELPGQLGALACQGALQGSLWQRLPPMAASFRTRAAHLCCARRFLTMCSKCWLCLWNHCRRNCVLC